MKKDELVARRDQSLMVTAMWLGGLARAKMMRDFHDKLGLPGLTKTHMDLFAHIDPDGTTVTEIARRKGVTKQSISKTVQELVEMGFLEARAHPRDSRSKLLSFNLKNGSTMRKSFEVLTQIDVTIANSVGETEYQLVLARMQKIIALIEAEDPAWSM